MKKSIVASRLRPPWAQPAHTVLETIAVILVLFWLLGIVSSYTLGGYIHILLVIALVTILLRFARGRDPLK